MKITVLGWYGKKNIGDESFRFVLTDFFEGHQIDFITPPEHCQESDLIVLGGGAVVSPFYLETLPKNKDFYAIGVDLAYESEINLLGAHLREIYLRNTIDFEFAKQKLTCSVKKTPDLAFYLQKQNQDILSKYKKHSNKKTIGVFVTDYVNPAIDRSIKSFAERSWSFKVNLAKELDQLIKEEYEIILIPCSTGGYGDDRRINLDLVSFMKYTPTNVMDTLDPVEMIDLMANLDLAICMRFHSHIFAIIANLPFVSIDFTRKVRLFLKEHDLENQLACRFENNQFLTDQLKPIITKTLESPQDFSSVYQNHRKELLSIKNDIRRDWLGECF